MNLDLIKQLAENKGVSIRKLADSISKTEQGLHGAIRNNTLKAIDLGKIANVLGVSVDYFFDTESNTSVMKKIIGKGNNVGSFNGKGNNNAYANNESLEKENESLKKEIEYLKEKVKDRDRIIHFLESENKRLKNAD